MAAFTTEFAARSVFLAALVADQLKAFSALVAELRSLGVLNLAFWALHLCASWRVNLDKRLAGSKCCNGPLHRTQSVSPGDNRARFERYLHGGLASGLSL